MKQKKSSYLQDLIPLASACILSICGLIAPNYCLNGRYWARCPNSGLVQGCTSYFGLYMKSRSNRRYNEALSLCFFAIRLEVHSYITNFAGSETLQQRPGAGMRQLLKCALGGSLINFFGWDSEAESYYLTVPEPRGLTHAHLRLHLCAMHADTDPIPPRESSPENADQAPNVEAEAPAMDPWEELEAEAAKWKEISLRTAAEMDNLRKRAAREREESIRYANQRLLEDLLPVIDNFEMGMQAASQDTKSMIYIGMDMVRRQLNEFLTSQGVEDIPTSGAFDPNLHDAVSQEECAAGEEGRILRVHRRGFRLRDRLLRPASVVVSTLPTPAV